MMTASSWTVLPADPHRAQQVADACGVPRLVGQILLNRGLRHPTQARRFLHPQLEALSDPLQLPELPQALRRLHQAIRKNESVVVFGDSDVDGITAATIVSECLGAYGARVTVRLSNRMADGYGFPVSLVRPLARAGVGLLILVDCGTNQPDEVQALADAGVDVIILDHHVPSARIAKPLALVNPRLGAGSGRELCSAGLAAKLAHALYGRTDERWCRLLDLVALGTLADYAPLVGDNRIFVAMGLEQIAHSPRPGLRQLCESVGATGASVEQILRRLVPRLNAAGRLGDARPVWQALSASSSPAACRAADALDAIHADVKRLHRRIVAEAHEQASRIHFKHEQVMVVARRGWHAGLMGAIAANLVERYGRPAITLALDDRLGVGSGRSPEAFNLFAALRACEPMLLRYGGHPQACGLTLQSASVPSFRDAINRHAQSVLGSTRLLRPIAIDAELRMKELTSQTAWAMERLQPFGAGNPSPRVLIRHVAREEGSAARATLTDGTARLSMRGRWPQGETSARYDIVVRIGRSAGDVVLSVEDLRISASGVESGGSARL